MVQNEKGEIVLEDQERWLSIENDDAASYKFPQDMTQSERSEIDCLRKKLREDHPEFYR